MAYYNRLFWQKLRTFLREGFLEEELIEFCASTPEFQAIKPRIINLNNKDKMIRLIVTYAKRQHHEDILLTWVQRTNPLQYATYQQYFQPSSPPNYLKRLSPFFISITFLIFLFSMFLTSTSLSETNTSTQPTSVENKAPATLSFRLLESPRDLANVQPHLRNNIYIGTSPPTIIDTNKIYETVLNTEKGEMRFRLFDDEAPIAVNNFIVLALRGFYDGTIFYKVVKNGMVYGGDPMGNGTGGTGYQFDNEINDNLAFDHAGILAMANNSPNTNSSQFFITLSPFPELNGRYTIFGEIVNGIEILPNITVRNPAYLFDPDGDVITRIDIYQSIIP